MSDQECEDGLERRVVSIGQSYSEGILEYEFLDDREGGGRRDTLQVSTH